MGINYAKEYFRFRAEQKRLRAQYQKMGMSEESIQQMYALDREIFLSDCRFKKHTQELEPLVADTDHADWANPLAKRFMSVLSVEMEPSNDGELDWIDQIDTGELAAKLKNLSEQELRLLTLAAFQELTQREIAKIYGVSQASIHKRMKSIRKKISK